MLGLHYALYKTKKLTLEQVAASVGTDTGNLSRVERSQQDYIGKSINNLAKAIGLSLEEIFHQAEAIKDNTCRLKLKSCVKR